MFTHAHTNVGTNNTYILYQISICILCTIYIICIYTLHTHTHYTYILYYSSYRCCSEHADPKRQSSGEWEGAEVELRSQ